MGWFAGLPVPLGWFLFSHSFFWLSMKIALDVLDWAVKKYPIRLRLKV